MNSSKRNNTNNSSNDNNSSNNNNKAEQLTEAQQGDQVYQVREHLLETLLPYRTDLYNIHSTYISHNEERGEDTCPSLSP